MKLLYEGKAKKIYQTDHPHQVIIEFKDDATAFNGEKFARFEGKGKLNKKMTVGLFKLLEKEGIKNHLIQDLDDTKILAHRVEIIPLEVVVRNWVAGSLSQRLGQPEGAPLSYPLVEFYYKKDDLGDPMLNNEHIMSLGIASHEELLRLRELAIRVNFVLIDFFARLDIRLVDFKLEFGRATMNPTQILLADEISPDTCRLWDMNTGEKLDKDRFRRDLGDLLEGYQKVLERMENAVTIG